MRIAITTITIILFNIILISCNTLSQPEAPTPIIKKGDSSADSVVVTVKPGNTVKSEPNSPKWVNDVLLVEIPWDETIQLKIGQKIGVISLPFAINLDVTIENPILESIDPISPARWMGIATQTGETVIQFRSGAPPCDDESQPCLGMPEQVIKLNVKIIP